MRPASFPSIARALTAALACAFVAACEGAPSQPSESPDAFLDLDAREDALGVTCSGSQECTGGGAVYTTTYRVGRTSTSRSTYLQTFVASASARPAKVSVIARNLRPFTSPTAPLLRARIYGPVTAAIDSLVFDALTPVLAGEIPVASISPNAATGIHLAGSALEQGATYALVFEVDGVGASGTGTVLVGLGAIIESSYAPGAAYRAVARNAAPWATPLASRYRPAATYDLAFALSGADGSACAAANDCTSGFCLANACATPVASLGRSASSLSFPATAPTGTSPTQDLVLTNTGNQPLSPGITVTGPFTATANGCPTTLAPAASCTVSIAFQPVAYGPATGAVYVGSAAPDSPAIISLTGAGEGATATPAAPTANFPDTYTAHASPTQNLTITNSGNVALVVSSVTASSPEFPVANTCTTVPAGGSCIVGVTFAPTTAGAKSATLTLVSNAFTGDATIALSGLALLSLPVASLSSTSVSFPDTTRGTTSAPIVTTLTNAGQATLAITSLTASGDFAATSGCGASLAEGASCAISVSFTPGVLGARTGTLTITDSASGSPRTVSLSGNGVGATATPDVTSLSFPATYAGNLSAAQVVTLTNSGNVALTVTSASAGTEFTVSSNTCASAAAGATCAIGVRFTPTSAGAKSATLTVVSNAMAGNTTVALSGTALQSALTPTSQSDYDLAAALGSPTVALNVVVEIGPTVTLSGSSDTAAALTTGALPAGSTVRIVNRGNIYGGRSTAIGAHGGTAIRIAGNYGVTLENHGKIYGAGGNGGRGGRSGQPGGLGQSAQGAATAGGTSSYGGVGYGGNPASASAGGTAGAQTWYGPATNGFAGRGGDSCHLGFAPWAGGGDGYGGDGTGFGGGAGGCSMGYGGCGGGGWWGGAGGAGGLDNALNGGAWQYTVNGTRGGSGGAAIEIPASYSGSISITANAGSSIAGAVWNDLTGRYYTGNFASPANTSGQNVNAPAGIVTSWNNGVGRVYR